MTDTDGSSTAAPRKRPRLPRAALACTFCRQRKARCSGAWPACSACARRSRACVYPGMSAAVERVQRGPVEGPTGRAAAADPSGWDRHGQHAGTTALPLSDEDDPPLSADLRRQALRHFREHYASTLLCFLPPQQLVDDDAGDQLAPPLLLCILALVSRFVPALVEAAPAGQPGVTAAAAAVAAAAAAATPESKASTTGTAALRTLSDHYAQRARRALDALGEELSLVHVQCCLVLCVYEVGEGAEHRGWLRLGRAVRLAQLLQLHRQDASPNQLDWGNHPPAAPADAPAEAVQMLAEVRRRTFWCVFCMEKLLANGRDRIAILQAADIATQLPQADDDFIYGRQRPTGTLACRPTTAAAAASPPTESLFALTIRVIDLLSDVMTWHGRGGRHLDERVPWLPDMPFSLLDGALERWRAAVPPYYDYAPPRNLAAILAAGQGRMWALMFMIYFQARAYLHREYLPFTPKRDYDPARGPCDGPVLVNPGPGRNGAEPVPPPPDFWRRSAVVMVESAHAISDLYAIMKTRGLSAAAYPIPGLGLLTAASIHVMYATFGWDSMRDVVTPAASRRYLRQDMEAFNDLGQHWSLAIHWIRQTSLYYKLQTLTKRSWSDPSLNLAAMDIHKIKDGIMNYVRQISQQDREARDEHLHATFNFDSWLAVLEQSVGEGSVGSTTPALEAGGASASATADVANVRLNGPPPPPPPPQLPAVDSPLAAPGFDDPPPDAYDMSLLWFSNMDGLARSPALWMEEQRYYGWN